MPVFRKSPWENRSKSKLTEPQRKKGLLIVNTGDGKGKTTAALGMALRAAGHGMRVCFIQFIKGTWKYGELESVKRFEGLIDFHVMGKGFTWKSEDLEKDKAAAREAWDFSRQAMRGGQYDLVVLDEFTYLLAYGMIDDQTAIAALLERPEDLHVVVTGRRASLELRGAADLVTEMRPAKHPLEKGIKAQKGIEF
ncbi:MAG: cob(I)yrinic acid a,c-diamide adenosyltransferase [Desulfatitalea sp.]|nr:cob(I)yrinic acid a,c-diamide adenosyltransferase [Desulfatitalea sp.]NNK01412.1 cob(I)yrinic acid a,c-diamide adenosyltransferase [Desulfatitalea sp.]